MQNKDTVWIMRFIVIFTLAIMVLLHIYKDEIFNKDKPKKITTDETCPLADSEYIEVRLYPSADLSCSLVPGSDQWLCSPIEHRGPDGKPTKKPEWVLIRLLPAPENHKGVK